MIIDLVQNIKIKYVISIFFKIEYVNKKRNFTKNNTKLKKLLEKINEYKYKENIEYIELEYMYYNCACENECNFIHSRLFPSE